MQPKEKAKKGLLLLQEAIVDIVKANEGISSSQIVRALSIETSDKQGKHKDYFGAFILVCSEGTTKMIIGETLEHLNNSKLESFKQGRTRCWKVKK